MHPAQKFLIDMLDGNIQVGTNVRNIRQDIQQFFPCFIRIAVKNAEPVYSIDSGGFSHQVRECGMGMILCTVTGGILGNKNMFPDAASGQGSDFFQNSFFLPAPVRPANQRNRTESAAIGTSFSDSDIGGIKRSCQQTVLLKIAMVIRTEGQVFSLQSLLNRAGQTSILVDTHQKINLRQFFQQIFFIPL